MANNIAFVLVDAVFMTVAKVLDNSAKASRAERLRVYNDTMGNINGYDSDSGQGAILCDEYIQDSFVVRFTAASVVVLNDGFPVRSATRQELNALYPNKGDEAIANILITELTLGEVVAEMKKELDLLVTPPVYYAVYADGTLVHWMNGVLKGSENKVSFLTRNMNVQVVPEYALGS